MTEPPKPPPRAPPVWAPCDQLAELARILLEQEVPPGDENQKAPPE